VQLPVARICSKLASDAGRRYQIIKIRLRQIGEVALVGLLPDTICSLAYLLCLLLRQFDYHDTLTASVRR